MKAMLAALLLLSISINDISAMQQASSIEDKCKNSDVIIKCAVLSIQSLPVPKSSNVEPEGPSSEPNFKLQDSRFLGPNAVALVRVDEVLKGDEKLKGKEIYVPFGYVKTVSPSELTKSEKYVLFLESMGHNFYHPLDPFSMHRISKDNKFVGLSGLDWEGDFDPAIVIGEITNLDGFLRRVEKAVMSLPEK